MRVARVSDIRRPSRRENTRAWSVRHTSKIAVAVFLLGFLVPACSQKAAKGPRPAETLSAAEFLARGIGQVDAAQKLRMERSPLPVMGGVFGWPPDTQAYLDYYARARAAFTTVLERYPGSAAASEAQFMLGVVDDHPHLNNFDRAVEAYRLTVARYPGTAAAGKAKQRMEVIERILR